MSSTANRNAIRIDARMETFDSGSAQHVFLFLLAFRIVNALTLRTFFQPDEYYQSLEPAWQLAFGPNSGAWLTWVRPCIAG
jgi:GPI mannosyltransferase 3